MVKRFLPSFWSPPFFPAFNNSIVAGKKGGNYPWNLECFVEDLFLGGQWSIILGYRRLSVKSLLVPEAFPPPSLLPGHYAIIKGREEGRGKGKQ